MTDDSGRRGSIPASWFEAEYTRDPDPWRFATSAYEAEKYTETLAALGDRNFTAGLEVGCSIGVFTARLAPRCASLLAVDASETALARAREACAAHANVQLSQCRIPDEWPAGRFDLILFSEVLYYLEPPEIDRAANLACDALLPGGVMLLVHWTGATDYPCSGDEAADRFIAACGERMQRVTQGRRPRYRLDRLDDAGSAHRAPTAPKGSAPPAR